MYNITGWSGGGRRPLTYNLMPGQFRNTRVNVFPSQTIINNNIGNFGGCYDYGHCGCDGGSSTPKWMNWMMGIGFGTSLLGSILGMFGGGGGGGAAKADAPTDEFASLKTLYPKNTFSKVGDTYVCVTKDGKQIRGTSPEDLLNQLGNGDDDTTNPDGAGSISEDPRAKEIAELKAKVEALEGAKNQAPTKETKAAADPFTPILTKGLSNMTDAVTEESYFKEQTGADVYKLDTGTSINISNILDLDKTTPDTTGRTGNIQLTSADLEKIKNGETVTLSTKFSNGKDVKAKALGEYLLIISGTQEYIVGKVGDKYKGFEFKGSNTTGNTISN